METKETYVLYERYKIQNMTKEYQKSLDTFCQKENGNFIAAGQVLWYNLQTGTKNDGYAGAAYRGA